MTAKCGNYYLWTDECRKAGCKECGTIRLDGLPPEGCTCAVATEIGGYVYQTTLTRSESCALHGRCQCGNGPMKYDNHREVDYWDRVWRPACPLTEHVQVRTQPATR